MNLKFSQDCDQSIAQAFTLNASRHSALSYEHAGKIEAQLKAEVAELPARAEAEQDHADVPDGMSIPDELARREKRLAKLAQARAKIEARAKERFEREAAEHKAKLAVREAKAKATGNKPTGKPPQPPMEGARPTDQINLTDEASSIMPVAGGGFEQCYTTPLEAMSHRLQTPEGKKLYALRKQILGIIKSVMGFRQFLLRGLENVQGEWTLVTMAWNMRRMFTLADTQREQRVAHVTSPFSGR